MAIRFPRMHVAQSAVNRIVNVAKAVTPQVEQPSVPDLPDVEAQGEAIDGAVQQPVGAVAPIDGIEDGLVARALEL